MINYCDQTPVFGAISLDNSFVICKPLNLLNCSDDCALAVVNNGLYLCDCDDSWNCHLCGNDQPYFNTYNGGDSLFLHFQQIDYLNGQNPTSTPTEGWDTANPVVTGQIFPCCDPTTPIAGIITDYALNYMVGLGENIQYDGSSTYFNYQNIELDTGAIHEQLELVGDDCFFIKFTFYLDDTGLNTYELCTEPFKFNKCQAKTLTIESNYPSNKRDCNGYYYGNPYEKDDGSLWYVGNSPVVYRNKYRFKGDLEKISESFTKEYVKNTQAPVKTQICSNYRLASYELPPYAVGIISNAMNGSPVYIDGKSYNIINEITKNNDTGRMWYIDTEVQRCCDELDLSCNT